VARTTTKYIRELQITLLDWYRINGRKFPWRNNGLTHYQLIIAETLLQRTKAETVSRFYIQFVKDFPNWTILAKAKNKEIENYLKPIGLYRQRAKRLKNLAAEMVKRKGRLPKEREDLESIPFLGQYIANAIELIIFKQPSPLIDVNMARVLERYFGERKMADIRYDPYLQGLARRLVDNPKSKELNWAVLDYAALVCKAQRPLCTECSLRTNCSFFQNSIKANRKQNSKTKET